VSIGEGGAFQPCARPRDRHMHRPSSFIPTMSDGNIHFYEPSTKCSSVPSSVFSSGRWRNDYGHHLCVCATIHSGFLIMLSLLGWTSMSPHFLSNNPLVCIPLWSSPPSGGSSGCSLLLHSFSLPCQPLLHYLPLYSCWLCLDFTGSQNEALSGIRTKRVWPVDPLLSLLCRPAPRLPPLPSPLRARAAFRLCLRLGLVMWSGLTSMEILWALLLAQSRIWPLPHSQPWSTQRTHLSIPLATTLSPCHHPLSWLLWRKPQPHLEEPLGQLHSCSDCASCSRIRDSVAILHDLVFVVRKDVDDLRFRLEHMDKRGEKIESLLSTLLSSLHSPELATSAPTTSEVIFAPTIQVAAECDVGKSDRQTA
jgi:hypothetical protein